MNYSDLDLNLVKVFCCVYESKSIISASEKMFISQPAVTSSIKRLEGYLGGKVFVRTPKGIVPTAEGESLYEAFNNCLKTLDGAVNRFKAKSVFDKGYLNIGSSSTIIRKLLLPFIKEFNKEYPNIVITVTDADSERLEKLTREGDVDLSVVNLPIKNPALFNLTKITQTKDCFIASKNFEKDFVSKDDIKDCTLILQKKPSSNRDYFERICEKNGVKYQPSFEIGSFGLITDFVAKDMGIAFTVENFIQDDIKSGRVKKIDTDLVIEPRDVCAITSITAVNTIICEKFIEELEKYFKN
ncbi:MAG: LysR family transcriptional regulator [Clostridiales bacterium]|nr:LysR family transcriptional regulator [Candidatus Apopatousia equi]